MVVTRGYQMAKVLEEVAMLSLEMDVNVEGSDIRYSAEDAMNALQIYLHVCQNIQIHNAMDKGASDEQTFTKEALPVWLKQADLFKEITGIDSRTYYKKP